MALFLLGYIKYFFLTGSVIFSLSVLLFVVLNLAPNISFGFLSHLSFIDAAYSTGTFSIGIPEVMKIFSLVSLIIMFASNVSKIALKKIFNINFRLSFKLKIIVFVTIITLAYIIAITLVTLNETLDNLFYYIITIFYPGNLISLVFYFLVDALLKKVADFNKTQEAASENYIA